MTKIQRFCDDKHHVDRIMSCGIGIDEVVGITAFYIVHEPLSPHYIAETLVLQINLCVAWCCHGRSYVHCSFQCGYGIKSDTFAVVTSCVANSGLGSVDCSSIWAYMEGVGGSNGGVVIAKTPHHMFYLICVFCHQHILSLIAKKFGHFNAEHWVVVH